MKQNHKSTYYMHQRFLLDCDYESVSLPESLNSKDDFVQDFIEQPNLFDTEDKITRKVKFSYLLKEIDTKEDFDIFLKDTEFIDDLLIENDMQQSENPIIYDFQNSCLKAFYKQLKK